VLTSLVLHRGDTVPDYRHSNGPDIGLGPSYLINDCLASYARVRSARSCHDTGRSLQTLAHLIGVGCSAANMASEWNLAASVYETSELPLTSHCGAQHDIGFI
jgi:hypothetical protein